MMLTGKSDKQIKYAEDKMQSFKATADRRLEMYASSTRRASKKLAKEDCEDRERWEKAISEAADKTLLWTAAVKKLETISDAGELLDAIGTHPIDNLESAIDYLIACMAEGKTLNDAFAYAYYGPEATMARFYAFLKDAIAA